ncbi:ATPase, T2SS/T4P/T4SS family [Vibrio parahaemolyticus]|uniref:ATPase, T2SS/T4P/T4SS family n=1 Tax=Vibrio parahaemolyticus TaxID=670 RepID=UPI0015D2534F|nr:ATPase, T2SS/T4P/T4SS family [Vibrio parahaemolyticus]NYU23850.1 hypothetical protein [Vibrio parahaemolyticus]
MTDFMPDFLATVDSPLPQNGGASSVPTESVGADSMEFAAIIDEKAKSSHKKHNDDDFSDLLNGLPASDYPNLAFITPRYYRDPLIQNPEYIEMCKSDIFMGHQIDTLLRIMEQNGKFDDVIFSSGDFTYRKAKKELIKLFHRGFMRNEIEEIIRHMYQQNGDKIINKVLSPGEDYDDAYGFEYDPGENQPTVRFRYRINLSAYQETSGRTGLSLTMRRLTTRPLTHEQLGTSDFIVRNCTPKSGLVCVAGETGSGKSTLCAAIATQIRQDIHNSRLMLTYESPIEYILTEIEGPNPIRQHSVGEFGHFTSFYDGLRNALRRTPEVIYLGESRDRETFITLPKIAESGHMGLTTLHADSIVSIFSRIANEVGGDKDAIIRSIVNTAHLFIVQYLAKNGEEVVPIQETLLFTPEVKSEILSTEGNLLNAIRKAVETHGQTMLSHAKELYESGKILKSTFNHIAETHGADENG